MQRNARFHRNTIFLSPILTPPPFPPSPLRAHAISQNEAKCQSVSHRAPAQNEATIPRRAPPPLLQKVPTDYNFSIHPPRAPAPNKPTNLPPRFNIRDPSPNKPAAP